MVDYTKQQESKSIQQQNDKLVTGDQLGVIGPNTTTDDNKKATKFLMYSDLVNTFVYPVVYKHAPSNKFVFDTGRTIRIHADCIVPVRNINEVEWVSFRGGFKTKVGDIYIYKHGQFIKYCYAANHKIYFPEDKQPSMPALLHNYDPNKIPSPQIQEAIELIFNPKLKAYDIPFHEIFEQINKKINARNVTKWMKRYDKFINYLAVVTNNPNAKGLLVEELID